MQLINDIYRRNKILGHLGTINLLLAGLLLAYSFFNEEVILGINSMIKPLKFALSIWIYSWTMAFLLYYVNDQEKVRKYSWLAVVAMGFEQFAIVSQALRGELSHFNRSGIYGIVLYALMGIFIVILTIQTLRISIVFIRQKKYSIDKPKVLSIQIGLILFVIFSFWGGYISAANTHTVGANDGGKGLPFINWSTLVGDLRVAHFMGIHALQIIPIFGFYISQKLKETSATNAVWGFSVVYFVYVLFTLIQAMAGLPFWRM